MTLDEFWEHIRSSRQPTPKAHANHLTARLARLQVEEILGFDHWWRLLSSRADFWALWGAAYLLNGGCSDDGFAYFRMWLLLQGREVYEAAVADPETLLDLPRPANGRYGHECYPASDAWFEATGTERDAAGYDQLMAASQALYPGPFPHRDRGEYWDFSDEAEMRRRLPRLARWYYDRN